MPKSISYQPNAIVGKKVPQVASAPNPKMRQSSGAETIPTMAKAPPIKGRYPLRPFSANISISLSGGPRPKFDRVAHERSMELARTHPKLLRRRIKADVKFLRQHPQCSNRVINYGLFRAFSLTISELKQLFGASSLTELIAICEKTDSDPHVFGNTEGMEKGPFEAQEDSRLFLEGVGSGNAGLGSDLAATKAVVKCGPQGQYVERISITQESSMEHMVCKRKRGGSKDSVETNSHKPHVDNLDRQNQISPRENNPEPSPQSQQMETSREQIVLSSDESNIKAALRACDEIRPQQADPSQKGNLPTPNPHDRAGEPGSENLPQIRRTVDSSGNDMAAGATVTPSRLEDNSFFVEGGNTKHQDTIVLSSTTSKTGGAETNPNPSQGPSRPAGYEGTCAPPDISTDGHNDAKPTVNLDEEEPKLLTQTTTMDEPQNTPASTPPEVNKGNISKCTPTTPPIPLELRNLPIDHMKVVLREPHRFGTTKVDRDEQVIHVHLNPIPTALTDVEKEFVYRCEKTGHTYKHQYQDTRQLHMHRCPLPSCGHSIINNKTMPSSIRAHFREYHNTTGQKYQVYFNQKGSTKVYTHEGQETKGKQDKLAKDPQDKSDVSIFDKKSKPSYTQPTILDAFLKMRKNTQRAGNEARSSNG